MDNSTKKLLEECSVGCKMGIESMEQVQHHVTDAGIAGVIEKYCSRHKELDDHRRQNGDRRRRKQTGSQNHHERMQHGNPVHHRSSAPMQRCILRKHLRSKETYQNGRESAG